MKLVLLATATILFCLSNDQLITNENHYFDYELIYVVNYFDTSTNKLTQNDTLYLLVSGNKNKIALTKKNYSYYDIRDFDNKMTFDLQADRDTNYYYQFPEISLNLSGYVKRPKIVKINGYSCNKIIFSTGNNHTMQEFYVSNHSKLKIASHAFIGTGGKIISKFLGLPVLINEYSSVNNSLYRTIKLHRIRPVNKKVLLSNFGKIINWD